MSALANRGTSTEWTFEQFSHVKVVPRFLPFLLVPPVTADFDSVIKSETLVPSSTGTDLLILFLEVWALDPGIATGTVGAREKVEEPSGPCGDAEEDMDIEARELRVVAALGRTAVLGTKCQ